MSWLAVLLSLASGCAAHRTAGAPPAPVDHVFPECTDDEKATGFSGAAVIKCVMTATGDTRDCRVMKPLPPMTERIVDAILRSRFQPVRYQGKPVDVDYTFTVRVACQ